MLSRPELIYLVPIATAPFILLTGKRGRSIGFLLSLLAVATSFLLSAKAFYDVIYKGVTLESQPVSFRGFSIVPYYLDGISAVMVLLVTLIGLLVVLYSPGYMSGEHGAYGLNRYYALITLFIGSMLLLVSSPNLILIFAARELVGLCSYALIGFRNRKPTTGPAAAKAMITTRIGDVLLIAAIGLLYLYTGSVDIRNIGSLNTYVRLIGVLIVLGAFAKSAQIPFIGRLRDAMEGPTTVSALIHAATMVNAGVYLVVRSLPLLTKDAFDLLFVAYFGITTAFLAATMALVDNDVKRVLAYSTISQLGYMFTAAGVAGYVAAMYHLVSHAFFKALLFLSAGATIVATHTRDARRYRLRESMKLTAIAFLVGALSLSAIPPTSGFYSKEKVISTVAEAGLVPVYRLAVITAFLTAFYIFRIRSLLFFRGEPYEAKESRILLGPVYVLVTLVLAFPLFNKDLLARLAKAYNSVALYHFGPAIEANELITLSLAITGLALGLYYIKADLPTIRPLRILLARRYFIDDLYAIIAKAFFYFGKALKVFDAYVDLFYAYVSRGFYGLGYYFAKLRGDYRAYVILFIALVVIGVVMVL